MSTQKFLTSACRYCRFYQPEGLQGGLCQQLSVTVRSEWKACQLAMPAFSRTWEEWEDLLPMSDSSTPVESPSLEKLEVEPDRVASAPPHPSSVTCMNDLEIVTWRAETGMGSKLNRILDAF